MAKRPTEEGWSVKDGSPSESRARTDASGIRVGGRDA